MQFAQFQYADYLLNINIITLQLVYFFICFMMFFFNNLYIFAAS